jgi:glutamate/tyrosine decarboxylase-like PLP-dependent enzyme
LGLLCTLGNVPFHQREINANALEQLLIEAKNKGKKYFITVSNMGTTMFGSVDNPDVYCALYEKHHLEYKLHIER